jgi:hypothetical protein
MWSVLVSNAQLRSVKRASTELNCLVIVVVYVQATVTK